MRHSRFQAQGILFLLLLSTACKKSDSGNPQSAANPAPASQAAPATQAAAPAPQPAPATQAAAPAGPPPPFSAAQKIGMFAYPKNNQSNDQQLRDEYDCYTTVQQQTGINPDTPAPTGPSAAEVQTAQAQAAENAPEAKGGRARGAAKGAVGGAVVGGIAGNAGAGAAVGATVGTVRGGRKQREANEASQQQAAQAAGTQMQQQASQAQAAYNKQMDTFKRGFSACMDARGYSVK
jgi:Glycine-zipper domain